MGLSLQKGNLSAFFKVPFLVYGSDLPFISQMDSELKGLFSAKINPMRKSGALDLDFFTVHDDSGKPLGRITVHLHQGSQKHFQEKTAFFGYLDCQDSPEVAKALTAAAESWARERGCSRLIGNFNLLATQMMGVMEEGFERQPYVAMNFGGPEIPGLLKGLGFERLFPMTSFETALSEITEEDLADKRARENLSSHNFIWKKASRRNFRQLLEDIRVIMNDAFEKNSYFAPLTTEEFWHQAKDLSFILDPEITALAYLPDGTPAGVVVVIPDSNVLMKALGSRLGIQALWEVPKFKLKNDRALLLFAAVRKDLHALGLGWTLLSQVIRQTKARGYKTLGITWVNDANKASLALARKIRAKPYHKLALYQKELRS